MNPILDGEHILKYLGGDVIGKVANDLEGVFPCQGPVDREDIGLDDVEVLGCIIVVLKEVFVVVPYTVAVKFNGDHFSGQGQQDPGLLPGAWSDLNDGIFGANLSELCNFLTVVGIGEKMLAERLFGPRLAFHPGMVT